MIFFCFLYNHFSRALSVNLGEETKGKTEGKYEKRHSDIGTLLQYIITQEDEAVNLYLYSHMMKVFPLAFSRLSLYVRFRFTLLGSKTCFV